MIAHSELQTCSQLMPSSRAECANQVDLTSEPGFRNAQNVGNVYSHSHQHTPIQLVNSWSSHWVFVNVCRCCQNQHLLMFSLNWCKVGTTFYYLSLFLIIYHNRKVNCLQHYQPIMRINPTIQSIYSVLTQLSLQEFKFIRNLDFPILTVNNETTLILDNM